MKAFASKEFDYTHEAKVAHAKVLNEVDNLERKGVKASVASVNKERHKRAIREAAKILRDTLNCSDRVERKESWQKFKVFAKEHRLTLSLAQLLKMKRLWLKAKKAA